ncbi:uncharacterized protein LOC131949050 [Physella acuta]|uniref:uncharacterized protein LOC131949050 n=1 Tax=Physella acuta TaxID=109671 RepID=UPI0027DBD485|nr:uncharacterized protein LOC131949050 [Physella acuta]
MAVTILTPIIKTSTEQSNGTFCTLIDIKDFKSISTIDIIVPLLIAFLLLFISLLLYFHRFSKVSLNQSDSLERPESAVDSPVPYILAVSVCLVCNLPNIIYVLNKDENMTALFLLRIYMSDEVLQDVLTYLLSMSWLWFKDVRDRIKGCCSCRHTRQNVNIPVATATMGL